MPAQNSWGHAPGENRITVWARRNLSRPFKNDNGIWTDHSQDVNTNLVFRAILRHMPWHLDFGVIWSILTGKIWMVDAAKSNLIDYCHITVYICATNSTCIVLRVSKILYLATSTCIPRHQSALSPKDDHFALTS